MQWTRVDDNLYIHLNRALSPINQQTITLWFSYLKPFLTPLLKLSSTHRTIWRGVKGDLSTLYQKDEEIIW
jgi:hypothetical protein